MSKINDFVYKRFGVGKALHFLVGGWITSIFSAHGIDGVMIGILVTVVLSVIKECAIDEKKDVYDVVAGIFGSIVSLIAYIIISFF